MAALKATSDWGNQLAATLLKPFTSDELLGTVKKVLRATDSAREPFAPTQTWGKPPSTDGLRP